MNNAMAMEEDKKLLLKVGADSWESLQLDGFFLRRKLSFEKEES